VCPPATGINAKPVRKNISPPADVELYHPCAPIGAASDVVSHFNDDPFKRANNRTLEPVFAILMNQPANLMEWKLPARPEDCLDQRHASPIVFQFEMKGFGACQKIM
jgi:hypothetical protein